MFLHYRTLQSLYFHVAGQHSFPLQFPLPLGRLRAGCSPMASLSSSKAPCNLTGQPELTEWVNSAACTQNCREILFRFSRFYRHFTLSSICWNLSGFHPILQGLFMPFTFHVYVKCTKNPWDKVWNASLRVPPLLIFVQDLFSGNGKAFYFPWERELRILQKPPCRILLL